MRPICATLLMFLVVKEGSCRHPGRTVPWRALVSPEDGMPVMASDNPPMPDKMPEPPKGLRRDRRFAPWELAELPMLASEERRPIISALNTNKMMHDAALRRDRRFAPRAQQTVAQIPAMPEMPQLPSGMPSMPQMPDMSQMQQMMPRGMPQGMPMQLPSGRKRRSPKDDKKDGKKKEKEQKPEKEPEEKPEEKRKPK